MLGNTVRYIIMYGGFVCMYHHHVCMADLADISAQYNFTLHVFADDNQLYIHCKPENVQLAVASNDII